MVSPSTPFLSPFSQSHHLQHAYDPNIGTPYVGTVDLNWGLGALNGFGYADNATDDIVSPTSLPKHRSPTDPPGAFRIPAKGQLQILIRNPSKTVVKVFLVPYDLRQMPCWSRTVIRQKSYIVGEDVAEDSMVDDSASQRGQGTLRFAIHLQFLCLPSPSNGNGDKPPSVAAGGEEDPDVEDPVKQHKRIYLFKSIRVVFSHRVPDGKERLKVLTEQLTSSSMGK
jgi:hypothetical protein